MPLKQQPWPKANCYNPEGNITTLLNARYYRSPKNGFGDSRGHMLHFVIFHTHWSLHTIHAAGIWYITGILSYTIFTQWKAQSWSMYTLELFSKDLEHQLHVTSKRYIELFQRCTNAFRSNCYNNAFMKFNIKFFAPIPPVSFVSGHVKTASTKRCLCICNVFSNWLRLFSYD